MCFRKFLILLLLFSIVGCSNISKSEDKKNNYTLINGVVLSKGESNLLVSGKTSSSSEKNSLFLLGLSKDIQITESNEISSFENLEIGVGIQVKVIAPLLESLPAEGKAVEAKVLTTDNPENDLTKAKIIQTIVNFIGDTYFIIDNLEFVKESNQWIAELTIIESSTSRKLIINATTGEIESNN
ncbi:DUF3221 domain-containing protein [Bacillus sp. DJP31]|uniref:DUF3221 domain-containing protein n=1 Tax=Bacillus sp. DJP31 TaxID=3409789 RepID=UPI003BB5F6D3